MRAYTTAAQTAASKRVTAPLYFVEINWSPVSCLSTNGDQTWNGRSWSGAAKAAVSGLASSGSAASTGQIILGNSDRAFGSLALGDVQDVAVRIWEGHADALADADPRLVFSGVIDSAEIDDKQVTLTLGSSKSAGAYSPRLTIGPGAGFNVLLPAGSRVSAGNQTFVIQR